MKQRSNIVEFLSVLQQVFAREPPVIARADPPSLQRVPQPGQASAMDREPPAIPPLPPELAAPSPAMERSVPRSGAGDRPPKLPPKPFSPDKQNTRFSSTRPSFVPAQLNVGEQQYITPTSGQQQPYTKPMLPGPQNPSVITRNEQTRRFYTPPNHPITPAYPPQPRRDSYSPVSPLSPEQQHIDLPSASMQGSQPSNFQRQPPRQALFEDPRQTPASHQPGPFQSSQHQRQIPSSQPYPDPRYQPPNSYQAPQAKTNPTGDLLTSPFENPIPGPSLNVAPPPIPRNPQKDALLSALSQTLTQQVQSSHDADMAAIPLLRAQQSALHSALTSMNHEISQLNDLQSLLTSNEAILHRAMRDADKVMEDAKHRKVPNVDDVLVAPTVVARQLYELVADETSLEECRGVVGRALDRGRIGGDVWAKVSLVFF